MSSKLSRNIAIPGVGLATLWLFSVRLFRHSPANAQGTVRAETPLLKSGDWPQWRGPKRNGVSSETGWSASWPASGPPVLWRKAVGSGYSSVAVQGGRAYTLGNKDDTDIVYCLDAASGKEVWSHEYACRGGPDEPGPRATPTVAEGAVYTVSRHGDIRCLDPETGKTLWTVEAPKIEQLKWSIPRQGLSEVSASPLVEGNLLIVNVERAIVALEKATGNVIWVQKDHEAATGGHSSPLAFDLNGERCVLIFGGREAVGLSVQTGEVLWTYPWQNTANAADPSVFADEVFISSGYGTGCAVLKPRRGGVEEIWRNKRLSTHFSSAALWEGHVYGFDGQSGQSNSLVCLDIETGDEKWRQRDVDMGTLIVAGGKLVMLSEKGALSVAEASPGGYKELQRAKVLDGKCWTVPARSRQRQLGYRLGGRRPPVCNVGRRRWLWRHEQRRAGKFWGLPVWRAQARTTLAATSGAARTPITPPSMGARVTAFSHWAVSSTCGSCPAPAPRFQRGS